MKYAAMSAWRPLCRRCNKSLDCYLDPRRVQSLVLQKIDVARVRVLQGLSLQTYFCGPVKESVYMMTHSSIASYDSAAEPHGLILPITWVVAIIPLVAGV